MWKNTSKNQVQQYMQQNPYRLLALSFFATMTIGTILLMLPISHAQGLSTTLVDAAFTAVSCVSVTGLSTVDTYHHWSLFGKIVMVILIQLGGLGIVSFTTIIALVLGRRVGLKNRVLLSEDVGQDGMKGLLHITKKLTIYTFCVEIIGGIIYTIQLYPYIGDAALYTGINMNTMALIVIGGFGYLATFDIWSHRKLRRFVDLKLHTKIMLVGTTALILLGTIIFLGVEWANPKTFGPLPIWNKIMASLFQSITPRTAGIATVDYNDLHPITLFITIIFMFIGAGPNSTGGGVKISTIAVAFLASRTLFNNRSDTEVFERRISLITVLKANGIIFLSILFVLFATCYLAWDEPYDFIRLLFEVTSAFGTVGLTTGITPNLSESSKWVLMLVMFTGRVGVMTVIGTWALRTAPTKPISYAEERVLL
ncbi:potassium transporter TrkG [Veillonella sp.]|uniref:TrkH family potassium uptake protein n=1 Tax=Veillonella sp. TaxID=1926307 RepID=UPI002907A800|nr:potassium transporter TrkG [Veillonella sp.]MDU6549645.1 potassium transporter TrkG [Veillonella sp.]